MKTMKNFLSMAALALMGAMTVSCSSDDNIIDQPQQQEVTKNNVVTLTTTVGFDEAAGTTRALDINYTAKTLTKTFAVGETMVLRYKNKKEEWVKAVSNALEAKDIADGSKSATFTFTLDNPDKTQNVDYIYPAAIVNQSGNMNEAALFGSQDGTLNTIESTFDYSRKIGAWDGDNLPSLTLENQLAILAITLKDEAGANDITSSITGLTLSDGTKTYNVTPSAAEGPIYVAIFPTEDATITVTATDGTKNYTKTLTTKTYAKGNVYPVSWRMHEVTLADVFTEGAEVNVKVNTANGYWFNAAGTYSSGSYTGVTQTTNLDEGFNKGISMTKDGNNLVVWMKNTYNEITITFNTTNNTYTVTAGEAASVYRMTTFNSITINGVDITGQLSEYVPPMETITFSSGSGTRNPDTGETLFTGTHFNVAGSNYDDPSAYFHVNKFDNHNMVISATDGKTITKVVFNYNWNGNLGSLAFTSGTFDGNATVNNVNASTLTVTSSHAAGTKFSGVTIYYE